MDSKNNKKRFQRIILVGYSLYSVLLIIGAIAFTANKDSYFSKIALLGDLGVGGFFISPFLLIATTIFAFKTKAFSYKLIILFIFFIPAIVLLIAEKIVTILI